MKSRCFSGSLLSLEMRRGVSESIWLRVPLMEVNCVFVGNGVANYTRGDWPGVGNYTLVFNFVKLIVGGR